MNHYSESSAKQTGDHRGPYAAAMCMTLRSSCVTSSTLTNTRESELSTRKSRSTFKTCRQSESIATQVPFKYDPLKLPDYRHQKHLMWKLHKSWHEWIVDVVDKDKNTIDWLGKELLFQQILGWRMSRAWTYDYHQTQSLATILLILDSTDFLLVIYIHGLRKIQITRENSANDN